MTIPDNMTDYVIEIPDFMSRERCYELIAHAEQLGFGDALISTEEGKGTSE